MEKNQKLQQEFDSLINDVQRWQWVMKHKEDVIIMLDNDDTYAVLAEDNDREIVLDFNGYLGYSNGIFDLLASLGVQYEGV